jgi:EpsI family protein
LGLRLRLAGTQGSHSGYSIAMQRRSLQIVLASLAILTSAVFAYVLVPRETMARSSDTFDLRKVLPSQFGEWKLEPNVRLIEPPGPDTLARQIYSQEIARGYVNSDGRVVMLLIAYGPNQSQRLQLHRPEICYAAEGFRVSQQFRTQVSYRDDEPPLKLTRLTAQREARLEPVSYWMRIGDDIATGVVERQLIRLKYVFRGVVPDGTLIRISTTGLPVEMAYEVQDRFIRDLLAAVAPEDLGFFIGDRSHNSKVAKANGQ